MVDVINCSAQTDKKTEKINIIVKSAEKFSGNQGFWMARGRGHAKRGVEQLAVAIMEWWIFMVLTILWWNARRLTANGQEF